MTVPGITPVLFWSATDIPDDDMSDMFADVGCCWWMLWALKCSEQRLPTSDNAAAALLKINNTKEINTRKSMVKMNKQMFHYFLATI